MGAPIEVQEGGFEVEWAWMTRKNFAHSPFTIGLIITVLLPSCGLLDVQTARREVESLPGAVLLPEESTSLPGMFELALGHLSRHDFEQAEEVYREIIAVEPEKPAGYVGLGSSLLYQDRLQEAGQAYERALSLSPDSILARIGLGSVALMRDDYATAERFYAQALEIDRNLADAHWGMALALDRLGRGQEALLHLVRFLALAPDSQLAEDARNLMTEIRARHGESQ
jgi:tetratricopeptide (TPR) repeat protein